MNIRKKPDGQAQISRSLRLFLSGLMMGASDVVPGVSGGTMAFILGIYENLLDAINAAGSGAYKLIKLQVREAISMIPWGFLVPLVMGIATAIFTVAHGLDWLLENYPVFVWAFFFGLVLGSVLTVRKRVQPWRLAHFGIATVFAVGAYWLVGLVPMETPNAPWFFVLSGALAICAMILPGISGAFILVLLGKYAAVLQAVVNFDFITLFLVIIGAVIGLLSLARILRWLFHNHRSYTIVALVGLMLGSLRKIWPWKEVQEIQTAIGGAEPFLKEINVLPATLSQEVLIGLLLASAGFAFVMVLELVASKKPSHEQIG
jgi:putative membrane protein